MTLSEIRRLALEYIDQWETMTRDERRRLIKQLSAEHDRKPRQLREQFRKCLDPNYVPTKETRGGPRPNSGAPKGNKNAKRK